MQSWLSRYPKALITLVASNILMMAGLSLVWPLVTLYVHARLGYPMTDAGLVMLVQAAANLVGSLIGGHLYDAWGGRRTIVTGALLTAVSAGGMAASHSLLAYSVAMFGFGLGFGVASPCIYAFAATVWPEGERAAFNAVYVASNLGVAIGSFAGGELAQISFRLAFAVTGVVFVIYLFWVLLAFRGPAWHQAPRRVRHQSEAETAPRGRSLGPLAAPLLLTLGMFLAWSPYVQWQVTIPTHMEALGFTLSSYSILWTVNGGLIVLGQPLVTWFTARVPRPKPQILVGTGLFIVSFLVLAGTSIYAGFLLAMVLTTFGEMLAWPAVPAAADELAPQGRRGLYQGLVGGAGAAGRGLGPLLGGFLYERLASAQLFAVMTSVFIVAFFVFAMYDRTLPRQRDAAAMPPGL